MAVPADQSVRARRVITRSPTRTVGRFPSLKCGRTIHWESQLERDFVLRLEFDEHVVSYREQPETIKVPWQGRTRRYTPDFLAVTAAFRVFYEVKPKAKLEDAELTDFLAQVERIYNGRGHQFTVVTETDIRQAPVLDNISVLLRYRRHPVDLAVERRVEAALRFGARPISELMTELSMGAAEIYALLARRRLTADLDQKLGLQASVTWSGGR